MTTEHETQREFAWRNWPNEAERIRDSVEAPSRRCYRAGCGAPVWFGITAANQKRSCFDIKPDGTRTGTNHWRTCRDRPGRKR